jgi:hypothetical protein
MGLSYRREIVATLLMIGPTMTHMTRARMTQIMNLLNLAPDIQEALLFLPPVQGGRDPVKAWQVRPIAAEPNWHRQYRRWSELLRSQPFFGIDR